MDSGKYIFVVQVSRQLTIDIVNLFAENGKKVILVTGVVESNYADLNSNIEVKYFNKHTSASALKRLVSWLTFSFLCFFYLLFKSRKYNLVLFTTPPFVVFFGFFFNLIRKQQYHLVIWDLYPDVLANMNVLGRRSILIRFWERANKVSFKRARNVFTLGEHLSMALSRYTNKKPIIVPNWSNIDFIKPLPKSENIFVRRHDLQDKFVVMYSGNIGFTHNVEAIVEVAHQLRSSLDIQFVIIGEGAKKNKIVKWASDRGLTNVLFLPYQDKEMLPFSLTSADIGIVTLDIGAENSSVPSKTYYLLAAGCSILAFASKKSELGNLVEKHRCGEIFEKVNASQVALYILNILHDNQRLNLSKENSRLASFNFTPKNAEIYYNYICLNTDLL